MNKKKRVLVFEDFESIKNILIKHLAQKDFEVIEASTLSEVLTQLNGTNIDLFIADYDIKDDSTLRVIKHMRDTTSYLFTPIILLITGDKEKYQALLAEYNIAMFLPKPFDITVLNSLLSRFSRSKV